MIGQCQVTCSEMEAMIAQREMRCSETEIIGD